MSASSSERPLTVLYHTPFPPLSERCTEYSAASLVLAHLTTMTFFIGSYSTVMPVTGLTKQMLPDSFDFFVAFTPPQPKMPLFSIASILYL